MTRRRWLPAAGVGLVLATGVVLATVVVSRSAATERRRYQEDAARAESERIVTAIERQIVEMERIAMATSDLALLRGLAATAVSSTSMLSAIALADIEGGELVIRTTVPSEVSLLRTGSDVRETETFDRILERVVVEADATAGAPFEISGREVISVAAPVLSIVGGTESEQRASVTGAVIGAIDVGMLIGDQWQGPVELVAPSGSSVADRADGSVLELVTVIRGRAWTLRFDAPPTSTPMSVRAVLVGGLLLAAALTVLFHREHTRRRDAEAAAASRTLQLERIAEAGARLQQSLDLGELLPAFSVALAADFDLEGVSIALPDVDGNLTEAFATGGPTHVASLDVPLRRGWRAVGVLSVRPGRPLDSMELTSLQALADLLAVAMSNAQLYEREQLNAARLRDLDALKNAFLGTVSHELRTSMTAIMGFGELLSDSWDNLDEERRREMAARIRRSAGSLRHLVDDLLDFARLEQERLRVIPRPIDLAGIVRGTVEGLTPLLHDHELDLQIPESLPAWADPVAVERIVANLLSNAAKYSPTGSKVTISLFAAEPDIARLVVADEGPGIPREERRRIFARFYRLDTPESVRTRGAGIGLAILSDFAERSGAAVSVDDAPEGGARFTIDFPTSPIADDLAVAT